MILARGTLVSSESPRSIASRRVLAAARSSVDTFEYSSHASSRSRSARSASRSAIAILYPACTISTPASPAAVASSSDGRYAYASSMRSAPARNSTVRDRCSGVVSPKNLVPVLSEASSFAVPACDTLFLRMPDSVASCHGLRSPGAASESDTTSSGKSPASPRFMPCRIVE